MLKQTDEIQSASEWPKTEEELKDVYYRLENNCDRFENEGAREIVQQFKNQIPGVIKEKDVKVAQELIDSMRSLDFAIMDEGLGPKMQVMYLNHFNEEFDTLDWSDRNKARMTLDRGLQLAANNPVKEQLAQIIQELYKLLPDADQEIVGGGDGRELVG